MLNRAWWCGWILLSGVWGASAGSLEDFAAAARAKHGDAGARAAAFLVEHMPARDQAGLSAGFLIENLDLAFKARAEFPWAKAVPEEIFLNDVLPYAVFDETRDPWRAKFYQKARELVKDARSASDAAQALNRQWFKLINVHYNTGRKRPNQSYRESRELGKATCTGLSIILAEACRSVGIPARAVGTPMWANERGNHTWTEIWDGDWKFTGADEYDAAGLNRGWFVGDAAQAKEDDARHAIYATSWKREGLYFPMVWAARSESVAAVNVTRRYARSAPAVAATSLGSRLGVRLLEAPGGNRMVARVRAVDAGGLPLGEAETKAGRADLNDVARFELVPDARGWLRFTANGETREMEIGPLILGDPTIDAVWTRLPVVSSTVLAVESWLGQSTANRSGNLPALEAPLSRDEAGRLTQLFGSELGRQLAGERKDEFERSAVTLEGKTLRWLAREFGDAPAGGHSLWISMHGGGGAPASVNDQQWRNQIKLYEPAEGIYVAPRGPTDTWNLWHEGHIDPLFQRLIEDYVVLRGVDPNRVYLLGYSAGGDGAWQLAPRMADRFAAACMMAGHPNEASLLGLRNLPFGLFVGAKDAAYNRNKIAAERAAELDRLAREDDGGYIHMTRIYEGLGHWMERKDAEGVPWMAKYTRQVWPKKLVWQQDDVVHRRFYWVKVSDVAVLKDRAKLLARVEDQNIFLDGDVPTGTSLRLSDALVDLDRPIRVVVNGREMFAGLARRQARVILNSLRERFDAPAAATAEVRWD